MNTRHLCLSAERYTPCFIIELARLVLGEIDLDPCSSQVANTIVKARAFYDKGDDGLSQSWGSPDKPNSIWVNPPGDRSGKLVKNFWHKLMLERSFGHIKHCLWMGYSLEQLQTSQVNTTKSLGSFYFCVPNSRIKFLDDNLQPLPSPTHANVIAYIPGTASYPERFFQHFRQIGICCKSMELT